jgi:Homeodomain-like domain-containing protein
VSLRDGRSLPGHPLAGAISKPWRSVRAALDLGPGLALVGMSIVERRYQAVLAVLAGGPVTGVAEKVGVSRQSVHNRLRRYADEGLAGRARR